MQKKAKELQAARRENQKSGRSGGFGGGFGSGSFSQRDNPVIDSIPMDTPKPSYTAPARYGQYWTLSHVYKAELFLLIGL